MNDLNTVIIEGVVKGEPHHEGMGATDRINFTVESCRYYKTRDGNDATERSQFKVVAYGRMCGTPLKDGSEIRLVGRLRESVWSTEGVTHSEVQIVAEHIEIRKSK
jgi:single-stranded DNA-binding protein